jgi:hypothetical protein
MYGRIMIDHGAPPEKPPPGALKAPPEPDNGLLIAADGKHFLALSWLVTARASWRSLLPQSDRRADSRADCTAGSNSPTSVPMIAMTTSSSTNVKAFRERTQTMMSPPCNPRNHNLHRPKLNIFESYRSDVLPSTSFT